MRTPGSQLLPLVTVKETRVFWQLLCDHKKHPQNEAESVDSRAETLKDCADDTSERLDRLTRDLPCLCACSLSQLIFWLCPFHLGLFLAQSTLLIHEDRVRQMKDTSQHRVAAQCMTAPPAAIPDP